MLQIHLSVEVEEVVQRIEHLATHDVVCDFVSGYAFGDALGVGVRAVDGWWTVETVEADAESSVSGSEIRCKSKSFMCCVAGPRFVLN